MTPPKLSRRRLLAAGAALALPAFAQQPAATPAATPARRIPKLTLAGPFATVSYPLIRMAESGALADVAEQVEFVSWKSPDRQSLQQGRAAEAFEHHHLGHPVGAHARRQHQAH